MSAADDNRINAWARSCLRKRGYRTHWDAIAVGRKCMEKRSVKLRYYRCDHCLRYHLTHHQGQGVEIQPSNSFTNPRREAHAT